MRAVLLTGYGGLEKLEFREDVEIPRLEAYEVLIKVGACGVNNTDIWTRTGAYSAGLDENSVPDWPPEPMKFPRIQGADIVGCIHAVGSRVPASRLGERVIVNPTLYSGDEGGLLEACFIGSERDGGFAEFTAVPAQNAHQIQSLLSDAELATFPTAYLTAEHMLNRVRLKKEETILITGASGGVGSALVQLAHIRGARVAALVGSRKEEQMRGLGAEIIVTRDVENLDRELSEALEGDSVDVVADVVGGGLFPVTLRLLRKEGRYVTAGAIAGPIVSLDLRMIYLKQLEIIGSTLGTRQEFADLVKYIETGKLKPLLAGTYPLNNIHQAQSDFLEKKFFGKLVIVLKGDGMSSNFESKG